MNELVEKYNELLDQNKHLKMALENTFKANARLKMQKEELVKHVNFQKRTISELRRDYARSQRDRMSRL